MILFLIVYTASASASTSSWVAWAWLAGATFATVPALLNPPTLEDDLDARISGTIGDPNELAALLVAGTAFAVVLTVRLQGAARSLRLAALGAIVPVPVRDLLHGVARRPDRARASRSWRPA